MAKVITMKIALNKKHTLELVTTVDPNMTVEKLLSMLCISGFVIKVEETPIMPLPVALIHSDNTTAWTPITGSSTCGMPRASRAITRS